ncbi:hypothetical protein ACQHM9_27235, partial [Escherichia coli]|uniref:hypothetical protein n=1 Tax=Escherichia coli TaxID=562 RepID=UPI003CF1F242
KIDANGMAYGTANPSEARSVSAATYADGYSETVLNYSGSGVINGVGPAIRYSASARTGYYALHNGTGWRIYSAVNGTVIG